MITLGVLLAGFFWMLRYRFRDRFMRAYALFFFILLFIVVNKGEGSSLNELSGDSFGPVGLARWVLLGVLLLVAMRVRMPANFRPDVPLGALIVLLLCDMVFSATYAEDFNYSLMRAASFTMLAVAVLTGFAFFLHSREKCLEFFAFHYYVAWLLFVPAMALYVTGFRQYGVVVLMGQYAGPFGNQNMFGIFSAMITPYVLFHWRTEAKTKLRWWLDAGLLGVILLGLWLSGSRGGMLACVIAVATYFFVINLESRLKIVGAAAFLAGTILLFPNLKQDFMSFLRKDTAQRAEISGVTAQLYEERRFELWSNIWPLYWEERLTGYGFAMSHLLTFPFSGDQEAGRHVHNSYLELFGDLGLPGITLFLLILARLASKALALIQRRGSYHERNVHAVFIAVFVAGTFNAFFESWMFSVGNLVTLMYWGPVAGVVAQWAWRPAASAPADPAAVLQRDLGYQVVGRSQI